MDSKVDAFIERADRWSDEMRALRTVLLDCDLIKFARYRASRDQAVASLDTARVVVEQSRPTAQTEHPAPPPEAEHVD